MTKRGTIAAAFVLAVVGQALAGVGEWRNYTSMKDVRGVVRLGTEYWAATGGGLFGWDELSGTFTRLTNAEGLQSVDLTAVAVDSQGTVWSGSSNGFLHAYSPSARTVRVIPNLAAAAQANKQINSIVIVGDTALIATDFCLSVIRISRFEFGDSYTKFAAIPQSNRVTVYASAMYGGNLFAAISAGSIYNGVAVASLSNPNLLSPTSWTLTTVGSPATVTAALSVSAGRLYAGTTGGLFVYNGSSWNSVTSLGGKNIVALTPGVASLLACTAAGEVFSIDTSGNAAQIGPILPFTPTSLASRANGDPVAGCTGGGLLTSPPAWSSVYPNGPNGNQFVNVIVDENGILWGASGSANGEGFYRYDGSTWKSYTMQNSHLPVNEYYKVSVGCDNTAWASSWGGGVVEMPGGTDILDTTRIYGNNVGMVGIPGFSHYIVISNVVCDGRGNSWMSVGGPSDKNVLVVRMADGSWKRMSARIGSLTAPALTTLIEGNIDRALALDASDNLWSIVRGAGGVVSFANGGDIDSVAPYFLTTANGLPSNDIRTIVVDRENTIWVGTNKGIGIILDPSNPTRNGAVAAYHPLDGSVVNTIAVDPLNQKWVGTSEGAILLSSDGTQELASYTVTTTEGKLIDNNVLSIAVDPKAGTVYFGTVYGLASLTTPAAEAKASFSGLTVFPNPFKVPSAVPLTVDGLVQNSSLKILTIDGRLVRDLSTPGGRLGYWDGKDLKGRDVSSGIYIIVAYPEDGSQVANGKVAVVKR